MDRTVRTPEVSLRRRDNRVHPVSTVLPAAQPVQSARASMPAHDRRRAISPWLVTSAAALAVVGVIVAGALMLTGNESSVLAASDGGMPSGRDAMSTSCAAPVPSEHGGRDGRCDPALDREESSSTSSSTPRVDTVDTDTTDDEGTKSDNDDTGDVPEGSPADPGAPDDTNPATPGPESPSTSPSIPGGPAPSTPPAPAPSVPAPPAPAPPPPPAAPAPLAFAGIQENHVIGLLGIRLLSSYTLSLSGQPGATASVEYGAASAGSVTFGSDGRASITLGGSLISAGLSNPTIRVAYSDGTAGSAIQAPRDSI